MIKELTMVKNNYLNNWELKKWDDVLDIRSGRNQKAVLNPNGKYPIIGSAGKVMGYADDYICEEGTTIIGRKGTINSPLFIEHKFWNVDTAFGLHSKESLDNRFLHYFCLSFDFTELDKGSGRPSLVKSDLLKVQIPLPPLPQQKQIVAILDKAFAAIDTAKANAEQNLQNAKELFESYLQNVFENKDDDWEDKRIDEVTTVLNGHSFESKDFSSENNVKSIKITNVGVKEFVKTEDNYLPSSFLETYKKYKVFKGNIVIALTRTIISSGLKVAVVPDEYDNSLLNQRVAALIPKSIINDDYLYHFFCTKIVSDYVLNNVNPLMQPNLSITDLKKLLIPCPSFEKQKEIVIKLNSMSNETKKLEAIYTQKIADLEEMKKSVLQKAFSGQLNTLN